MEKIIWVIGDDRLEMIEAQRRINAAGSMRALCLLSFEAVQKPHWHRRRGSGRESARLLLLSLTIKWQRKRILPVFFFCAGSSR